MKRVLATAVLFGLASCSAAPPSTAPTHAGSNDADTAQILGPASMSTPPPEDAPSDVPPKSAPPADTGAPAMPTAQTAPVPSAPPPFDLTVSPLPASLADGAAELRAKSWSKAKRSLAPAVAKITAAGVADEVIVAHTLLARAHFGLRDFANAKREYAAASAGADAAAKLVAADGDELRRHVREARLALVSAEVLFATAEEGRRAAEQKRMPVMRGAKDAAAVSAFAGKEMGPWMAERRKLIEDAERAYLKVLDVKPFAPPAFVIASSRAVGIMWDNLATSLASFPLPQEWQGEGKVGETPKAELRQLYQDALEQNLSPIRDRARSAFRVGSEQGKRFGLNNDDVAACDDWLAKHPTPTP